MIGTSKNYKKERTIPGKKEGPKIKLRAKIKQIIGEKSTAH